MRNRKGDAQCVELVKQTVGDNAPTSTWRQGPKVDANTPPGTAVGNFNREGKFDTEDTGQHAALLVVGRTKNGGIVVVEQYKGLSVIQQRALLPVSRRQPTPSNNAKDYNVILFPK
jgi:hypothetical protein